MFVLGFAKSLPSLEALHGFFWWLHAAKKLFSTMFLAVFCGLFWACFSYSVMFWGFLLSLMFRVVVYQCWGLLFCVVVGGSGEQGSDVCA